MAQRQYKQQPPHSMYNAVNVQAVEPQPRQPQGGQQSEEQGFSLAPSNTVNKTSKNANPTTDDRNLSFQGPSYIQSMEEQLYNKKHDPVKKAYLARYTSYSGM